MKLFNKKTLINFKIKINSNNNNYNKIIKIKIHNKKI